MGGGEIRTGSGQSSEKLKSNQYKKKSPVTRRPVRVVRDRSTLAVPIAVPFGGRIRDLSRMGRHHSVVVHATAWRLRHSRAPRSDRDRSAPCFRPNLPTCPCQAREKPCSFRAPCPDTSRGVSREPRIPWKPPVARARQPGAFVKTRSEILRSALPWPHSSLRGVPSRDTAADLRPVAKILI